jgi:large subunit ribosomal protein L15
MSDILSRLAPPEGARQKERRVGRGPGSGVGKISGRGNKGQKARQPGNLGKVNFQGGQTPMQRRLPKRGFRVPNPATVISVNVASLERFDAKSEVNEAVLRQARLVQGKLDRIKILGDGDLTKALTVTAHAFSAAARLKIESAGGRVVVLAPEGEDADSAAADTQTAAS